MKKKNPVVHFELPATDSKRMSAFYSKAFGWETQEMGPEMNGYILANTTETEENGMITTPGAINGGFYTKTDDSPAYPSIVIDVDDLEESIKMVQNNGGTIMGTPDAIPGVGKFINFIDTEGNVCGMIQPEPMG